MWYELIPGLAIMTGVTMACLHFGALEKYLVAKGKVNCLNLYFYQVLGVRTADLFGHTCMFIVNIHSRIDLDRKGCWQCQHNVEK